MATSFTPTTTTQKIPTLQITSRTVVQPSDHYECPVGKKAVFNGIVQCTSRGAAATASLRDAEDTYNLASWIAAGDANGQRWSQLAVGVRINLVDFQMKAGDKVRTAQSSGTNAEFNVVGQVLELPA